MLLRSVEERIVKDSDDKKTIQELKISGKVILIYGCATYAELVYNYLVESNLQVEAFVVDSQYYRDNFCIGQIKVRDIADYSKNIDSYNIVIGFGNVEKSRFIRNNPLLLKSNFYFFGNL